MMLELISCFLLIDRSFEWRCNSSNTSSSRWSRSTTQDSATSPSNASTSSSPCLPSSSSSSPLPPTSSLPSTPSTSPHRTTKVQAKCTCTHSALELSLQVSLRHPGAYLLRIDFILFLSRRDTRVFRTDRLRRRV